MEKIATNSTIDELVFLFDVLVDLRRNYPEHNKKILTEYIAITKNRIDSQLSHLAKIATNAK